MFVRLENSRSGGVGSTVNFIINNIFSVFRMSQKKNFQDTSTPVVNRKRRESKPTPPEREFSKHTNQIFSRINV
jgi:hypothetical protein